MTSLRAISLGSCCLLLVCFCLRAIAFSIPAYKQCQQQLRPNHYRQHSTLCAKQPRYLEVNGSVKYGQLYRTIATVLASFCLAGQHPMPSTASDNPTVNYSKPPKAIRPLAYSVEMLDPPEMQPRSHTKGEENLLRKFATATDVLLFGKSQ